MTEESKIEVLIHKAEKHALEQGQKDTPFWYVARGSYIAGAQMVLDSTEYQEMKEDADNWRNYQEEAKSLQQKLSVNWEKVEKWKEIQDIARIYTRPNRYVDKGMLESIGNEVVKRIEP